MTTKAIHNKDIYIDFLKKESIIHFILWILMYGTLVYLDIQEHPVIESMIRQLISISFYILIVYFNIYYLIPKFLSKEQTSIYLIYLTLTALVLTPVKIFLMYIVYDHSNLAMYFTQNQRSIFLFSFFMGLASTLFKIVNDWLIQQREMNILKNQTLESELRFLKSQINPHFLFNTLNSLYALTLKKSDDAPEIVLKLSEMMRYILYECNEKMVPLTKEVKSLQNYMELEKLRHRTETAISFDIDGDLNDQKIAPLLFMTFMENAFKHGLSNQLEGHYVKINLHIREGQIIFEIENSNAPKSNSYKTSKNKGIGLQNIKRRLTLLYPKKHRLRIENTQDKYAVRLELDLS